MAYPFGIWSNLLDGLLFQSSSYEVNLVFRTLVRVVRILELPILWIVEAGQGFEGRRPNYPGLCRGRRQQRLQFTELQGGVRS